MFPLLHAASTAASPLGVFEFTERDWGAIFQQPPVWRNRTWSFVVADGAIVLQSGPGKRHGDDVSIRLPLGAVTAYDILATNNESSLMKPPALVLRLEIPASAIEERGMAVFASVAKDGGLILLELKAHASHFGASGMFTYLAETSATSNLPAWTHAALDGGALWPLTWPWVYARVAETRPTRSWTRIVLFGLGNAIVIASSLFGIVNSLRMVYTQAPQFQAAVDGALDRAIALMGPPLAAILERLLAYSYLLQMGVWPLLLSCGALLGRLTMVSRPLWGVIALLIPFIQSIAQFCVRLLSVATAVVCPLLPLVSRVALVCGSAWRTLLGAYQRLLPVIMPLAGIFSAVVTTVCRPARQFYSLIVSCGSTFMAIAGLVLAAVRPLLSAITALACSAAGALQPAASLVTTIAHALLAGFGGIATCLASVINAVSLLLTALSGRIGAFASAGVQLVRSLNSAVSGTLSTIQSAVAGHARSLVIHSQSAGYKLATALADPLLRLLELGEQTKSGGEKLQGTLEMAQRHATQAPSHLQAARDAIRSFLCQLCDGITDFIRRLTVMLIPAGCKSRELSDSAAATVTGSVQAALQQGSAEGRAPVPLPTPINAESAADALLMPRRRAASRVAQGRARVAGATSRKIRQ